MKGIPYILNKIEEYLIDNTSEQITPEKVRELSDWVVQSLYLQEYVNDSDVVYLSGQCCKKDGIIYEANTSTTGTFNTAHWDAIGGLSAIPTLAEILFAGNDADGSTIENMGDGVNPQDAVTLIQLNEGLSALASTLSNYLLVTNIVNVLTDTSTNKALSAAQGKALKDAADALVVTVAGKQNTLSIPSDAEMQTGTENTKFTTALRTTSWWVWIKTQAQTIAGLWTFSGGITISGGRLLFTNTSTASGDGIYRSASNVITTSIANNARHEVNNLGVRTKGTHTFEGTMFTNIVPTVKKIATVQTTGELTADYVATTIFQGIQRSLQTLVSSTTETPVFNPEFGSTLIPIGQYFAGVQISYTIPFKLSTTGTVRFLVRFGEAATALTSRTILADTGTFSPAVTAQGGVLKVFFSVGTVGGSGTANLICNIECQINGKNPVITFPLRTSSGVSTLVDNLLEITCVFGTSSALDRMDVENANAIKIS